MTDFFTSVFFTLDITDTEAKLIAETIEICELLCKGFADEADEIARYNACSPLFRSTFPVAKADTPFSRLTSIFSDPDYPSISADFHIGTNANQTGKILSVSGSQTDPWEIADLLRLVVPSATPFNFGYANTASRDCCDAYGGGFIEVRSNKIIPLNDQSEKTDEQHFVISTVDPGEGLLFWNINDGFVSLEHATVFSEREAALYDLPIANSEPEWMALPPRHAWFKELA